MSMSTISAVTDTDRQIRNDSSVEDGAGDTVLRIWVHAPDSRSPASVSTAPLGITPPYPRTVNSAVIAIAAAANWRRTTTGAGARASRAPTPTSQITATTSAVYQNHSPPLTIGGMANVPPSTASAPSRAGTASVGGAGAGDRPGGGAGRGVGAAPGWAGPRGGEIVVMSRPESGWPVRMAGRR